MTLFSWALMRLGIRALSLPVLAFALLAAPILLFGCAEEDQDEAQDGKLKVMVTLAIFADFARHVGGDQVDVSALVPSSGDVHTYEPPPSRVAELGDADLVVMNGLDLEAALENVIEENAPSSAAIIRLAEALPAAGELGENPHLWLDVQNAMDYVEQIRDAMIAADSESSEVYELNAESYLDELRLLDQSVVDSIALIPVENRKLITFHDAYPYMAKRYGLEVAAVAVPSPGQEPSAKDVQKLVDAIREHDVPAVFKEPQFRAHILELAADDAGVEVCTLYSGSLDDEVTSYTELMRFNADELVRCLG
jgi:ABC-type Zn uptake system ZnuABC Zn-binding protein ZnuA